MDPFTAIKKPLRDSLRSLNAKYHPSYLYVQPEWIVLGVNNICNLHCKMCDVGIPHQASNFYQNLMGSKPLNMPIDLIKRIIVQTKTYFPKAKVGYAFTEPLIYPYLIESLALAADQGIYTSITTNALNLEKKALPLAEAGLNQINISLDGPPAIHNFIRGNKRSFAGAVAGIERILSVNGRRPEISVFCTITQWNVGSLVEFSEFFREYPLKQLGFMHTNFTSSEVAANHNEQYGELYHATTSNMKEINIEEMDLNCLFAEIKQIKSDNFPFQIIFSPELNSPEAMETFYLKPERLIGKICNDAFRTIMIKSDGSAIPSHGRCYSVDVGNVYTQTLKQIWNASELARFRQTLIKAGGLLPACSRCCSAF